MSEQPSGEIILYQRGDAPAIDVRLDGDTVWLSQAQLVDLFDSSKANISEHIRNIYAEGELSKEATVRKFRTVQNEGRFFYACLVTRQQSFRCSTDRDCRTFAPYWLT